MKPEELRIGNYVRAKSPEKEKYEEPVVVDKYYFQMFCENPKKVHFKPIPLTEEWLEKFGFEKYDYGHTYQGIDTIEFQVKCYKKGYAAVFIKIEGLMEDNWIGLTNLKYVHQLQNLIFALTGTELKQQINGEG